MDPIHLENGLSYEIDHLKPFTISYPIKIKEENIEVSLYVYFSNHCYTRSRKEGDLDNAVLFREKKRHGEIDERVFCPERWEFSKDLPIIVKELHSKGCYLGSGSDMFYRQEKPSMSNQQHGWYICSRLSANQNKKILTMNIRSAHYRTNKPHSIRGGTKRFYAVLAQFYRSEKEKREWL